MGMRNQSESSDYGRPNVYVIESQPQPMIVNAPANNHYYQQDNTYQQQQYGYGRAPVPPIAGKSNSTMYDEYNSEYLNESSSIKIRHDFVRKVLGLLSVLLTITFGLVTCAVFIMDFKLWLQANRWVGIVFSLLAMVPLFALVCSSRLQQKSPLNLILLGLISGSMGMSLAFIAAFYDVKVVSLAMGTTAIVVISCMTFAMQVKYDFTKWYPYAFAGLIILFVMGIVGWFVLNDVYQIIYGVLGTVLFSFLLILDTQMIVGGKRSMQYTVDMYVPATLSLYMDIIQIFMYLLRIFSVTSGD